MGEGIALIGGGTVLGLGVALLAWRRLSPALALGMLAAAGAIVGSGALLVQDRASGADWALTLVMLGGLTPLHAWLLFGRSREP